ncbi:MAG: hypothetical protein QOK05_719 [Chloroflexota bacterium]|jgi:SAM-dependent methyltransferase|nr:hypothetical protein [Chloroflexota bacterium]
MRVGRAGPDVAGVIRLAQVPEGGAVLDLCCGIGRHSLEFARHGYAVTGVDLNRGYLDRSRAQAEAEGLNLELVESDAREFVRPRAFDLAVNLYTSFGYFDSLADDQRLLQNMRESLRPGGALVIETMGKETVARQMKGRSWFMSGEDQQDVVLVDNRVIGAWERVELSWTLIKPDGRRAEAKLNIRLYSAVEMASLLRECGFVTTTVYGDLQGRPYDQDAALLVVVARAPG